MTLAFDALQKKTIQEVLEWYEFQVEVLGREKERILTELLSSAIPADSRFFGMSREEVDNFFKVHRGELDFVVILDLMSAAEAAIRLDYLDRVGKRREMKVATTASINDAMEKGLLAVQRLDGIVSNKLRDDPGTFAAWESARRVERAPHAKVAASAAGATAAAPAT